MPEKKYAIRRLGQDEVLLILRTLDRADRQIRDYKAHREESDELRRLKLKINAQTEVWEEDYA